MKNKLYNPLGYTPLPQTPSYTYDQCRGMFFGDPDRSETSSGRGDGDGFSFAMHNGFCDEKGKSYGRGNIFGSGCCSDESDAYCYGNGAGEGNEDGTGTSNL